MTAIKSWPGTQSLLSMWFHDELVPAIETYGLAGVFTRVDGLRTEVGGDLKAGAPGRPPGRAGIAGEQVVLIGDSLDDAAAADVGRCRGRSSTRAVSPRRPGCGHPAVRWPTPWSKR